MKTIRLVGGLPIVVETSYYDETVLVTTAIGISGTGYDSTHTIFTLPSSETYNGTIKELRVEVNGKGQHPGEDFEYEVSTTATMITFYTAIKKNGRVRLRKLS